jgi:superfamily II DNA or RNA helicase
MRNTDIIIHKKNHATVIVECTNTIAKELYNYFSAFANNYRFAPLYKAKMWDGKIRFFSITTNELPIGLVYKLYEFSRLGNYTIECKYSQQNSLTREELQRFIDTLGLPPEIEVRPYQFEAIYDCITNKVLSIEASTASGKSLMIYIICRILTMMGKKTLLVCSQQQLVEQMFGDFEDYGWEPEKYCHRIYSGQKKIYNSPVIIACWQSLITEKVKESNPYELFDCMILDEAHGAKAKSIKDLSNWCVNAAYRFGFSGTYPDPDTADYLTITGSTGAVKTVATYQMLQAEGYIAKLKIYNMILSYSPAFKRAVFTDCGTDYKAQSDMINNAPERNQFLLKMIQNLKGNVLVLFTKKEAHGYILKELFERELKGKRVLYIDGDVPIEDREDIRRLIETRDDIVLLGTYGCLSTGTNMKNLMHLVFASGYKSRVKTMQAIGRSLRLHKNKLYAKLYDVVDDVSFIDRKNDIRFVNHSFNHYVERSKYYINEGWDVKSIKYKI